MSYTEKAALTMAIMFAVVTIETMFWGANFLCIVFFILMGVMLIGFCLAGREEK